MSERMSKHRHALGLFRRGAQYAMAAVKVYSINKLFFGWISCFQFAQDTIVRPEDRNNKNECVHILCGGREAGALYNHFPLRPSEARFPQKSEPRFLARLLFSVLRPSLISKQLMIIQILSFSTTYR